MPDIRQNGDRIPRLHFGFRAVGHGVESLKTVRAAYMIHQRTGAPLIFGHGIRVLLDRLPRISGEHIFQERPFVILEDGGNNRGVIDKTGLENRVRYNVGHFPQIEERKRGLGNRGERNRSIETGLKIFNDFCEKLDLVRKIREIRYLSDRQADIGQQANQLIQMGRRDPTCAVGDETLQFVIHSQWAEG
jgi:hypothetical protein